MIYSTFLLATVLNAEELTAAAPTAAPVVVDDELESSELELDAERRLGRLNGHRPALGAIGPRWTWDPSMEAPAGTKDLGTSRIKVYTPEQQARLGVDEYGEDLLPAEQGSKKKRSYDDFAKWWKKYMPGGRRLMQRRGRIGGDRDEGGCIPSAGYHYCEALDKCIRPWEEACPTKVGGDRDAHGCIPSAGYTYCESLDKCIQPWEETCPGQFGGDRDANGCIPSAGQTYCESLDKCIQSWEETCPPLVGGDRDAHGCIPSAGQTYCETLDKCIQPWEETCPGLLRMGRRRFDAMPGACQCSNGLQGMLTADGCVDCKPRPGQCQCSDGQWTGMLTAQGCICHKEAEISNLYGR